MIRSCIILVLLAADCVQIYADPGRAHHDQPSHPKRPHGSQWGGWAHSWDQFGWYNVQTTQRAKTRKSTKHELEATNSRTSTRSQMQELSTASSRPTVDLIPPQPIIRDVEIRIKEDPTGDIHATSTRSGADDVGILGNVTPTDCTTETRTENTGDQLFLQEEKPGKDLEMSSHWHVGIYRTTEMPYTQICGGSLIKSDKVISAGHCFWTFETKLLPANQFAAAAGKLYRAWDDPRDLNAQYSDIKSIVTTHMLQPCFVPDLALLTLVTPFRYDGAVKPVCLEIVEKENLTTGDRGVIAGWGDAADACSHSDRLVWFVLPFVHTLNCRTGAEWLGDKADKICAGDTNNRTQCESDSGSGLVFFNETTPYLRGVATFVAQSNLCIVYNTPSFTPAGRGFDFSEGYFKTLLESIISSEDCQGFYRNITGQFQNGKDEKLSGQSASNEVGNVTTQNETTDFNFTLLPGEEDIILGALGTGSTPVPTLGNTSAPAYQWHVGIYSKAFTPYMQICGGTLVKLDVVISAAHCFWDDAAGQQPASQFAVAGGKLHRPWRSPRDAFAQLSNVSAVTIPIRFRGETTSFQDDIAVVRLRTPFTRAPGVQPACVDFGEALDRLQLARGNLGTVAGWGLTKENGTPSQRLNYLELPYVEIGDCFNSSEASFLKYITSDKICAGDQFTGKALCRGDSGGGLILFSGSTPYLRGVASTAANNNNLCNAFAIATFTQIYAHRTFLRDNVPDIDKGCIVDPANGEESGAAAGNGAESGVTAGNGAESGATFGNGAESGVTVGNGAESGATFGNGAESGVTAGNGAESGATAGNGADSGTTVVNGAERLHFGAGSGFKVGVGMEAGTGGDMKESGSKFRPPLLVRAEGSMTETTLRPFEHSHLVPYNNFICNCNCKS